MSYSYEFLSRRLRSFALANISVPFLICFFVFAPYSLSTSLAKGQLIINAVHAVPGDVDDDGVLDIDDIDDDNDGVLDIDEGVSCSVPNGSDSDLIGPLYYSFATTTSTRVVSPETTYGPHQIIDGDNGGQNAYNGVPEPYNPPLDITITNINPIDASGIYIANDVGVSGDGIKDFTIEFFDVDGNSLGTETMVGSGSTNIQTLSFSQSYSEVKTFVLNITTTGTGGGGGGGALQIRQIGLFGDVSEYCDDGIDTDGDGIPNHQDLDSDADSCSDGVGASNTTVANNDITNYNTGTDANSNGLLDQFEDGTTGNINYSSTYDPIALSSALNACADTDGDGISDLDDIDDDNDGVLDATESPSCFYTQEEVTAVDWAASEITFIAASPITNAYDGDAVTFARYTDLQDIDGVAVLEFALTQSVELSSIHLQHTTTVQILEDDGAAQPATARFQAWNGSAWVDLTADFDETAIVNDVPLTLNAGEYQQYRLFGVDGRVDGAARLGEIAVTAASDFNSSIYPKASCTEDLDGDGLFNHLDPNTDGDTCSDAHESTNTTNNTTIDYAHTGAVGTNGLVDALETSPDSGVINYASTYNQYADSAFLDLCADTDGDGISDLDDIDDDNDGVLDATESPSCYYAEDELISGDRLDLLTVSTDLITYATNPITESIDGLTGTSDNTRFNNAQALAGLEAYHVTLPSPMQLDQLKFNYASTYGFFNNGVLTLQGSNDDSTWTDLNTNTTHTTNPNPDEDIFPVTQNAGSYQYYRLLGVSGTSYSNGYGELELVFASGFNASSYPKEGCGEDFDGDGIFNHLDLDSDADSCSDGVGASNTTVANNDITNYNTGTDANSNGLLDQFEDGTTGNINYSSTYDPIALSSALNACADTDGDGISDLDDIDDDNDGVLDATESPSCFYTQEEVTAVDWAASEITFIAASPITNAYDGDAVTFARYTDLQDIDGVAVLEFALTQSVELSSIHLQHTTTVQILEDDGAAQPATARFQAWNGSAWVDLTADFDETAIVNDVPLTLNAGEYQQYRLFGVDGRVDGAARLGEIAVTAASDFNSSIYPKASCTEDLDGDGLFNHHDLDSDADTCSDSVGASNTAHTNNDITNYNTGTDANGNGLLDQFEDGTTGNINYSSTYSPNALSSSIDSCLDTDGDGISDINDIDDDNDGVLDVEEGYVCSVENLIVADTEFETLEGKASDDTFNSNVTDAGWFNGVGTADSWVSPMPTTGSGVWSGLADGMPSSNQGGIFITARGRNTDTSTTGESFYTDVTGLIIGQVYTLQFEQANAGTEGATPVGETTRWLIDFDGEQKTSTPMDYLGEGNQVWMDEEMTFIAGATDIRLEFFGDWMGSTLSNPSRSENMAIDNIVLFEGTEPECESKDTDGDGIPNHHDLDSDADSCSDGVGASNTTVANNDITNYNTGTDANSNGLLDQFEDGTTGTNNYTSTYDPFSVNGALNACIDTDGDGLSDLSDIDDDNDGIVDSEEGYDVIACDLYSGPDDLPTAGIVGHEILIASDPARQYAWTATGGSLSGTYDKDFSSSGASGFQDTSDWTANQAMYEGVGNGVRYFLEGEFSAIDSLRLSNDYNFGSGANDGIEEFNLVLYASDGSVLGTENITTANSNATQDFNLSSIYSGVAYFDIDIVTTFDRSPIQFREVAVQGNNMTCSERYEFSDTDGDGISDHLDLDSDNDGISDLLESGQDASIVDTDNDGVHDSMSTPATGDTDGDGLADVADGDNGGTDIDPVDTDNDGIDDRIDLDSDNDAIPDTVESRPTSAYQANDGDVTDDDADGDGVVNLGGSTFDTSDNSFGGDSLTIPEDTDGDGIPDYIDVDSDEDGIADVSESGITISGNDANGDGIDDAVNASYSDPDGDIDEPTTNLENETGDISEVGYRETASTLSLFKVANPSGTVGEGDTITYTITAINQGGTDLTNVSVSDPNLTNLSCLPAIPVATLAGGAQIVCTGVYEVVSADVISGVVDNTATATGTNASSDTVTEQATASVPVTTPETEGGLDTQKYMSGLTDNDSNGIVSEGDELAYTITATNTTSDSLSNVVITDSLIDTADLICLPVTPVASLDPMESVVCTGSYIVTAEDISTSSSGDNLTLGNFDGTLPTTEIVDGISVTVENEAGTTSALQQDGIDIVQWNLNSSTFRTFSFDFAPFASDFSTTVYDIDGNKEYVQIKAYDEFGVEIPFDASWISLGVNLQMDAAGIIEVQSGGGTSPTSFTTNPENAVAVAIPEKVSRIEFMARETLTGGRNFGFSNPVWGGKDGEVSIVGKIDNVGTATGTDPDGGTVTGVDTSTVTTDSNEESPALDVTKSLMGWTDTDTSGSVSETDVLAYTLTATNTGNTELTGVSLSDSLIASGDLTCTLAQPTTLAIGETLSCTGSYAVASGDAIDGDVTNEATGVATGPNSESLTDKETVVVDIITPPTAELTLSKTASVADTNTNGTTGDVGDIITYTYTVENTGALSVFDITVSESAADFTGNGTLPTPTHDAGGADLDGDADDEDLSPGSSLTWTATYTIVQADVDQGDVANQADASGTDPDGNTVTDESDDPSTTEENDKTTTPTPGTAELTLSKTASVADTNTNGTTGDVGDIITYTYTVENTGALSVFDITVSESAADFTGNGTLPTPTHDAGGADLDGDADDEDLSPGSSLTWTATYTIVQADVDQGDVANQADASGTDPDGNTVTDESDDPSTTEENDKTTTPTPGTAELTLSKTASVADTNTNGTTGDVGDIITYTYTVENTGALSVFDITVSESAADFTGNGTLPTPTHDAGGADLDGDADDEDLSPGSSLTWTATYTIVQADVDQGDVANQADASGTDPDGNTVTDESDDPSTTEENDKTTTPTPGTAELTLSKTASVADTNTNGTTGDVGDIITYTYTVENTGALSVFDITVSESAADFTGNGTLPTPTHDAGGADLDGDADDEDLSPGSSLTWTATYTIVQADVDQGDVANQADASGTDPDGNTVTDESDDPSTTEENDKTTTPTPGTAELTLSKTASVADTNTNGTTGDVGDIITYTYTVENTGALSVFDITVSESAADFTGNGTLPTPTHDAGGADLDGDADDEDLSPGSSLTWTATYTIVQADVDQGDVANQADASGTDPDGNTVTDESDDPSTTEENDKTTTPTPGTAELTLSKTASVADTNTNGTTGDVGDIITYTYTVENTGALSVFDITVSESAADFTGNGTLPTPTHDAGGADLDGDADDEDLSPGSSLTWTATYTIVQADVDQGDVANQADASGTDPDGNTVTDESDDPSTTEENDKTTTPTPGTAELTLSKTASVADTNTNGTTGDVGDIITYTYTVENTGALSVFDITVSESAADFTGNGTLPTPTHDAGGADLDGDADDEDLSPGSSLTWTATYTIVQADVDQGDVANQADASGTDPDGNTVTDESDDPSTTEENDKTTTPTPGTAELTLSKTASVADTNTNGTTGDVGDIITYTYTVENTGALSVFDITVSESAADFTGNGTLPTPTHDAGGADLDGDADDEDLSPGSSLTWTATYTIVQADVDQGDVANQADASGTDPDGNTVTDESDDPSTTEENDKTTTPTPGTAELTLSKTASVADTNTNGTTGDVGDIITYTYTVENTGALSVFDITVSESAADFTGNGTLPTPTHDAGGADLDGDADDEDLSPGSSLTWTATYTIVQADVDQGDVANQADASGTDPDGNTVTDESDDPSTTEENDKTTTDLSDPELTILKVGTPALAQEGDTIIYTITATNSGNVNLTNVAVSDPLIASLDCTPTAPVATLAPDEDIVCVGTYAVTAADVTAGQINNTATAIGTDPNGNTETGTGTETTTTAPVPTEGDLTVQKTLSAFTDNDANDIVSEGDELEYAITTTNTMNVDLTNVSVTDSLISSLTCTPTTPVATLAPGARITCTGTYTVGVEDVTAGKIDNTATATATDPDGNTKTGTDTSTVTTDPNEVSPALDVTKLQTGHTDANSNGDVDAGDKLSYTLTATNTGNTELINVSLSDSLISSLTCTPTAPATLAVGEAMTCAGEYTVTTADVENGIVANEATGTGIGPGGKNIIDEEKNVTDTAEVSPEVTLTKEGDVVDVNSNGIFGDAGDIITYTYITENTGNVNVFDVTVSESSTDFTGNGILPTPVYDSGGSDIDTEGDDQDLAPGETTTWTSTYTIVQTDVDQRSITNQATASGTDPDSGNVTDTSDDPTTTDENDKTTLNIPLDPELALTKQSSIADTNGNGTVGDAGDMVTYTYVTENTGPVTITNVSISESSTDFTGNGTLPAPTYNSGGSDQDLGGSNNDLLPDETVTWTATYTIVQDDVDQASIENQATASGTDPDNEAVTDESDDPTTTEEDKTTTVISQTPHCPLPGTLDWTDVAWLPGATSSTYTVDGVSLVFDVDDPAGSLASSPATYPFAAPFYQGGLATVSTSLLTSVDLTTLGTDNTVETMIAIGDAGVGVEGVHFQLFDIDGDLGTFLRQEEALITGSLGGAPVVPMIYGTPAHDVSGALVTGYDPADSQGAASYAGTVTVVFPGAVDAIQIGFGIADGSVITPGSQLGYGLSDIHFCLPEPNETETENDIAQTPEDTPVSSNLLTNDTDEEGDEQAVQGATGLDANGNAIVISIDGAPTAVYDMGGVLAGTISINSDGSYTFVPATGYVGVVPIIYTAVDDNDDPATDSATLTIEVLAETDPDGNDRPIAHDDTASTEQDTDVSGNVITSNDYDPDGDTLIVVGVLVDTNGDGVIDEELPLGFATVVYGTDKDGNTVVAGELTLNPDGTFVFDPDPDFTGEVLAAYTIEDEEGITDSAFLTITVDGNPEDNNTYANDDTATGKSGEVQVGNVLGNDTDPESNTETIIATEDGEGNAIVPGVETELPSGGLFTINPDGSFTYEPKEGFVGTEVIIYTKCDDGDPQACDTATLYLTTLGEVQESAIALTKTGTFNDLDGDGVASIGDTITYEFIVTNTGSITLTNVTITDDLVAVVGGPLAELLPGVEDTSTFSATYVLTEEDISGGAVENQAVVNATDPDGNVVTDLSDDPLNLNDIDVDNDGDPDDVTRTILPIYDLCTEGTIGNHIWLDVNGDGKEQKGTEPGISDVSVTLEWAGPDNIWDTEDDQKWKETTGNKNGSFQGKYQFTGLSEGRYRLELDEDVIEDYVQTYDPTGSTINNRASIALGCNEEANFLDFGFTQEDEEILAETGYHQ